MKKEKVMTDLCGFSKLANAEQESIARELLGDEEYERRQRNMALGMSFDDQSVREHLMDNISGLPSDFCK
jgi:hypothetical protein